MLWACQSLTTLPDPNKPVWEQDAKILETLMFTEKQLKEESKKQKERLDEEKIQRGN